MNTLYADLVRARIAGALAEAEALRRLEHRGLKGELREVLVARLLAPLLPPTFGITSGVIISSKEQQSAQTDVIVFDRTRIPPFLVSEKGLVPVEAVLFAIEVKSSLTMEELRKADADARALLAFDFLPDETVQPGERYSWRAPISALFAFSSDLKPDGRSELDRLVELTDPDDAAIKMMCVVGRGTWRRVRDRWSTWPTRGPHDEVLGFLAGVMNTIGSLAASRGFPAMGNYVGSD